MRNLLVAMSVALLMAGCGGDGKSGSDGSESNQTSAEIPPEMVGDGITLKAVEVAKIDLDDNETRNRIIAEAIDWKKLEWRGKEGERLFYAPNQQTPYTGWAKRMWGNGQIYLLFQHKDGKLWTVVAWKPNGEKCPDTNVVNGNGVWVRYNPDGTERSRYTYENGE